MMVSRAALDSDPGDNGPPRATGRISSAGLIMTSGSDECLGQSWYQPCLRSCSHLFQSCVVRKEPMMEMNMEKAGRGTV